MHVNASPMDTTKLKPRSEERWKKFSFALRRARSAIRGVLFHLACNEKALRESQSVVR